MCLSTSHLTPTEYKMRYVTRCVPYRVKFVVLTALMAFQIQQVITDLSEENARLLGVLLTLNFDSCLSVMT